MMNSCLRERSMVINKSAISHNIAAARMLVVSCNMCHTPFKHAYALLIKS